MTDTCPKCLGEGLVATSDDQEPWSAWESLPIGSDVAVRLGLVQPMPCPECRPTEDSPEVPDQPVVDIPLCPVCNRAIAEADFDRTAAGIEGHYDCLAPDPLLHALATARAGIADRDPFLPGTEFYGIPSDPHCPFCAIVHGIAPATIVAEWPEAIAIAPIIPVVDGHVLVLPRAHVADATTSPYVTGAVMLRAAQYAERHQAVNLITSRGRAATQSVFHLHIHIVPRQPSDGLALPWTQPRHGVPR